MDWITPAVSLLGGGLIVESWNRMLKRGQVSVDECNVTLHYTHYQLKNRISYFDLNVQFINSSGYDKILNKFTGVFLSEGKNYELLFRDLTLNPALIVEAKSVKLFKFNLYPAQEFNGEPVTFFSLGDQIHFSINYMQGKKRKKITIKGPHIVLKDDTHPFPYVG